MTPHTLRGRQVFTRSASAYEKKARKRKHPAFEHVDEFVTVSTSLASSIPWVDHPRSRDDWTKQDQMWQPEDSSQWTITFMNGDGDYTTADRDGYLRFRLALSNSPSEKYLNGENPPQEGPDLQDAHAVAEFLAEPFVARHTKDDEFNGMGRTSDCYHCDGIGTVCQAPNCSGFCTDLEHDAERLSDPGCSCVHCNVTTGQHSVTCPECDGTGTYESQYFHRRYEPYLTPSADVISGLVAADSHSEFVDLTGRDLSARIPNPHDVFGTPDLSQGIQLIHRPSDVPEEVRRAVAVPSETVLKIVQTGLNVLSRLSSTNEPAVSDVLELFHLVYQGDITGLVERVVDDYRAMISDDVFVVAPSGEAEVVTPGDSPTLIEEDATWEGPPGTAEKVASAREQLDDILAEGRTTVERSPAETTSSSTQQTQRSQPTPSV